MSVEELRGARGGMVSKVGVQWAGVLVVSACAASCTQGAASNGQGEPSLRDRLVRVGGFSLDEEGVKRILALGEGSHETWVESALLAEGQRRQSPNYALAVERVAHGQRLLDELLELARAEGPPTDAEVDELTQARWWELSRPRMVEVVHAVVLATPPNEAAEALAREVREAVMGARDVKEFESRAKGVPTGELKLQVEALPPVAPDGRALFPERPPPAGPRETALVEPFANAAQQLAREGEVSPVVATSFGYHVMRATRIIEAEQPDIEVRRQRLATEIHGARADRRRAELLARLRREVSVQPVRAAVSRMGSLHE